MDFFGREGLRIGWGRTHNRAPRAAIERGPQPSAWPQPGLSSPLLFADPKRRRLLVACYQLLNSRSGHQHDQFLDFSASRNVGSVHDPGDRGRDVLPVLIRRGRRLNLNSSPNHSCQFIILPSSNYDNNNSASNELIVYRVGRCCEQFKVSFAPFVRFVPAVVPGGRRAGGSGISVSAFERSALRPGGRAIRKPGTKRFDQLTVPVANGLTHLYG